MGSTSRQGLVQAPAAAIYRYVADVGHAPEYIIAFTAVLSGPEPPGPPTVGQQYRMRASFLGSDVVLGLRLAALDPDRQVQIAMEGQPRGMITIALAPAGDGATHVHATLESPQYAGLMLNMVMGGTLDTALQRLNAILDGASG